MTISEALKVNEILSDIDNLGMILEMEKMSDFIKATDYVSKLNDSSILHEWTEMSVEFFNNKLKEKEEELKNM